MKDKSKRKKNEKKIAFIFKQINWPFARCHKNVNAFCFAYFAQ